MSSEIFLNDDEHEAIKKILGKDLSQEELEELVKDALDDLYAEDSDLNDLQAYVEILFFLGPVACCWQTPQQTKEEVSLPISAG